MKTISLGKTHIKILPIGFGTGFNFNEKIKERNLEDGLKYAISCGVKLIDTAENYGDGVAEEVIGRVTKNIRNNVVLATKFSPENSSRMKLVKSCENSLRRLKTSYIDLYQFHWPNPSVPLEETLETLLRLKKSGKVRFIGASNFSKEELQKCFRVLGDNLVSLQVEYNLLERTIEETGIDEYCKIKGLSLIAYSPLDQGRLNSINRIQLSLLKTLSAKYGKTPAQIVLSWVIRSGYTFAIPRSLSKDHIRENVDAAEFEIFSCDLKKINEAFTLKIKLISTQKIFVSHKGERGNPVYKSLDEAIKNEFGFTPSPVELSEQVKNGKFLKPVRLIKKKRSNEGTEYDLIGGRIRYWAWLITFGEHRSIPAFIRENIQ